ncbi:mannonate dehydratase [Pontibacter sp. E15-1]|uniref:mannonate dehydratase n=1 Tax=Pontibacter sp. E15-1 TaxID=2919918 RepID=UPI001F4FDCBF|nr:mannonate dehydratase [Pontibacter sp. E15-1]MCJ8165325.1 mannonate dehydratase [Pontibacter sp. E15-1]
MALTQSWRWYGPNDPVSLQDIKQAGATGIVSALHHIPHGEVWPLEEIQERKRIIEAAGLSWVVVESVPVHEAIKTRSAACESYLEHYRTSLRNLAACGIRTVCYNFMPVLDWTRTDLAYTLTNGAKALQFDWVQLAIFDLYILKRAGAEQDYAPEVVAAAQQKAAALSEENLRELADIILMGVPTEGSVTVPELLKSIEIYKAIGRDGLRENLVYFLKAIMDVCEETGINMTIHPDDPPYAILGLPRVVSSKEDLLYLLEKVDRKPNGICFCTGSLGAGRHNDPVDILKAVGHRVYFAHLRNVLKDATGSFYESDHLTGDVDMYGVMKELVALNSRREQPIPFRPDHGHQMLDDLHKTTNPGYSAIGRLRGLAELRGLEMGIQRSINA